MTSKGLNNGYLGVVVHLVISIATILYMTQPKEIPELVLHEGIIEDLKLRENVKIGIFRRADIANMTVDGVIYTISAGVYRDLEEGMKIEYKVKERKLEVNQAAYVKE